MGCSKCLSPYKFYDGKLVCPDCGVLAPYRPTSHTDLINENYYLRKTVEDFYEWYESGKEILDKLRNTTETP